MSEPTFPDLAHYFSEMEASMGGFSNALDSKRAEKALEDLKRKSSPERMG